MMGTKAKLSHTEQEAFGVGKYYYTYLTRPGVTKTIKRLFNRRIRRKSHVELAQDVVE